MAKMYFMDFLRDYLNTNLTIYTVRRFFYDPPEGMVFIPGVGGCHRDLLKEDVGIYDLESYYKESGFKTKEAWWSKIKEINKSHPDSKLYLYKIVKVR